MVSASGLCLTRRMPTLDQLPTSFAAGTTIVYTRTSADYKPTAGWTLALHIAGKSKLTKAASSSGDTFTITLAATDTSTLSPGVYQWQELATKGTEVQPVAYGQVTVTPNMATALAGDLQSWEEKALELVEAALVASAGSDVITYQIHGRGVTRSTREAAASYCDWLRRRIQRRKNGGKIGQRILSRFRRPS